MDDVASASGVPVITVITSGGDAPGMNGATRAVVRMALHRGAKVLAAHEGYQGLVEGDVRNMAWEDVAGILDKGGTAIGTARCKAFQTRDGMKKAVLTLVNNHCNKLVVIGGDGSLKGATEFSEKWPELVKEMQDDGTLTASQGNKPLVVVGIVASIDNDMCGTDMTIGADTALWRIVEAVDAIQATAASHQRTFVVEVMGRNCGWLALMSSIANGADYVFVPEKPPSAERWKSELCDHLFKRRSKGSRSSIVIVAEGARDDEGNPIPSTLVRDVITERLGFDTRLTILGHVQRGGAPSYYDRVMSSVLGIVAVDALLSPLTTQSVLLATKGTKVTTVPLAQCSKMSEGVHDVLARKQYDAGMEMRGTTFVEAMHVHGVLSRAERLEPPPADESPRIGLLSVGAGAPGVNAAVRAAVRLGADARARVLGICNGVRGLIRGDVLELDWMKVNGWSGLGGSILGTNRQMLQPRDIPKVVATLAKLRIDGLCIFGGWEALRVTELLASLRDKHTVLDMPILCVPATISNNLPATDFSIGCDTSVNNIVRALDKIKEGAVEERTFVVEVMGRNCGYLTLMSGLASGAELVYIPEEPLSLSRLSIDAALLRSRFRKAELRDSAGHWHPTIALVVCTENTNYRSDFIETLLKEEGKGCYTVRRSVLGHMQQGGSPSPMDRIRATKLAAYAVKKMLELLSQRKNGGPEDGLLEDCGIVGEIDWKSSFTPLKDIKVDEEARRAENMWWLAWLNTFYFLAYPPNEPSSLGGGGDGSMSTEASVTHHGPPRSLGGLLRGREEEEGEDGPEAQSSRGPKRPRRSSGISITPSSLPM